jgi:MOSC domain-containing protein YiiM
VSARVLSLRVGAAKPVLPFRGHMVSSGIYKDAVDGRLHLAADGLPGDEQADLSVHGGPDKAVCCYPSEHFAHWRETIHPEIGDGGFGENLTLAGLTEHDACIGDTYTLGDDGAVVQVSQPRGPCYKVGVRWSSKTLVRLMGQDLKAGFYLRVLEAGTVGAGDSMDLVDRVSAVTVAEVLRVTYRDRRDPPALQAVMAVPALAEQWRHGLRQLAAHNLLPLTDPVGDD